MKIIFLTTRRKEKSENTYYPCDCIETKWYEFLKSVGNIIPIFLPNDLDLVKQLSKKIKCDGVILTGGDNIQHTSKIEKMDSREEVENFLLSFAASNGYPVLGVCRGMQKILSQHDGSLIEKKPGHVGKNHKITFNNKARVVNSFHDYIATSINQRYFNALAIGEDTSIEAASHIDLPFLGIMWHPERMHPISKEDIHLFREHFSIAS